MFNWFQVWALCRPVTSIDCINHLFKVLLCEQQHCRVGTENDVIPAQTVAVTLEAHSSSSVHSKDVFVKSTLKSCVKLFHAIILCNLNFSCMNKIHVSNVDKFFLSNLSDCTSYFKLI